MVFLNTPTISIKHLNGTLVIASKVKLAATIRTFVRIILSEFILKLYYFDSMKQDNLIVSTDN